MTPTEEAIAQLEPASVTIAKKAEGPTLEACVPAFLRWFQFVRRRSVNTVSSYGWDLKSFLDFAREAGLTMPAQVGFRHLEFYVGMIQQEPRSVSARTANRHLHSLRSFWRWMVREGLTAVNPAADCFLLQAQKTLPDYLTIPQQEKVLTELAWDWTLLGRRDYALVATGLLTGLRRSELANLQVAHVDLEAGRLRVTGKGRKDRELPIVPRLEKILRGYLEEVRPQLLGRPMGSLRRRAGERSSWTLTEHLYGGRSVRHNLGPASRSEAERRRAELIPLPPEPAFLFVNAHPTGAQRARRAGQPLLGKTIFALVRRAVEPIIGRRVGPHALRHSFASRLRENGADPQLMQEALGHASIATTAMYAHLSTSRRRQELARFLDGEPGAE